MFNKIFLFVLIFVCSTNLSAKNKFDGMSIYLLGKFSLSPEGTVSGLSLATSKFPEIDKKISQQISTWKFKPVVIDGKAIDAQVEIDVLLDVALDANGLENSVQIASVRFELLNGPKYERINSGSYGFNNIYYPESFYKIVEADALVAMSTKPDGSVDQIGIKKLRIFPASRLGLSDSQIQKAIVEFSNSIQDQRPFIGANPVLATQKINCEKVCMVMIHYNFPTINRFRKWRGYQEISLPRLEWLKDDEREKQESNQNADQFIKLIDPKQARVTL